MEQYGEEKRQSAKYHDKLKAYDAMLAFISADNVDDAIRKARSKRKRYTMLAMTTYNINVAGNIKKIACTFDPYREGTIVDILVNSLPEGYKVHVYGHYRYTFLFYISWAHLSIGDKWNLWCLS